MSYETILLETDGPVATITLNRPKQYNAFNNKMRVEVLSASRAVNADPAIRIVIIKGAGPGFSAGADLAAGEEVDPISDLIDGEYKPFLEEVFRGDKLYIAQVHGSAAGVGAALALTCDLMVMDEKAFIYQAFHAIALVPDGGNTWFLLQQLGYRRALEAIVEGTHLKGPECKELGLCNHVVPADELDSFTREWAERLAAKAPLSLAATKRLLRNIGWEKHGAAISMEAQEQNALMRSKDCQRGIKAFFAKEKPVFKGD